MPSVAIDSVDTKENRKHEIRAIFEFLRNKLVLRTQDGENNKAIIVTLQQYETELLAEIDYLDLEYDHPLRAARALQNAIDQPSPKSFNTFQKEATDSKFNPRARTIAWVLLSTLAFTALMTVLAAAAILSGIGAPLALIAATGMGFTIPIGCAVGHDKLQSYAPVVNAIMTGDKIARNLKLFKPAVANLVDNVDPKDISLLPKAVTFSQ
ncbi:MAG: hypothetical protein H0U75_08610 [Legionella sp.]|nr:hypothetical protein [Legionella sp.]